MDPKLKMLCELYDRSGGNIDINSLLKVCFFKELKDVLELLSHKQCIKFGYLCAKSVSHLVSKKSKKDVEKCLELIEKFLISDDDNFDKGLVRIYSIAADEKAGMCSSTYSTTYVADAITTHCNSWVCRYIYYGFIYSLKSVENKNKQEQKYKNLSFLIQVIKEKENGREV